MKKRNPIVFLTATVTFMVLLVMGGSTLLPALALEAAPYYHTQWGNRGSGDGQFQQPSGIAIDSSGNVYVADTLNSRIQKFDSDGVFVTKWGSEGSGDGEFQYPGDIAMDKINSSNVYVADIFSHRIQKFGVAPPTLTPTSVVPSFPLTRTPTLTPTPWPRKMRVFFPTLRYYDEPSCGPLCTATPTLTRGLKPSGTESCAKRTSDCICAKSYSLESISGVQTVIL